ncbi:hypothetical protein J6590_076726 [Homalodisca vitripennis]|nr:hypothetical protein J6590_076726 [Homalodisca vitripennis]
MKKIYGAIGSEEDRQSCPTVRAERAHNFRSVDLAAVADCSAFFLPHELPSSCVQFQVN